MRSFALISVTGARTGTRYTTPVQPIRLAGDRRVVVLSQRHRRWWRNIRANPRVVLERGAAAVTATARVVEGDDLPPLIEQVLLTTPRLARFYRIAIDDDGRPDPAAVNELAARMVAIVIDA